VSVSGVVAWSASIAVSCMVPVRPLGSIRCFLFQVEFGMEWNEAGKAAVRQVICDSDSLPSWRLAELVVRFFSKQKLS
jgi:hypothetical protein